MGNNPENQKVLHGSCHCGAVQHETAITVPDSGTIEITECDCSMCSKTGFLHLIVPKESFKLSQGEDQLTNYQFGTKTAKHYFCKNCGVKSFYIPRSHPDGVSINFRCIKAFDEMDYKLVPYDGKNWSEDNAKSIKTF